MSTQAVVRVSAVLRLRPIAQPQIVSRSATAIESLTRLEADGNVTYQVRARLAPDVSEDSEERVYVRNADGVFTPLSSNVAVVVAMQRQRGHTESDVECRVESTRQSAPHPVRCALIYDYYTTNGDAQYASTQAPSLPFAIAPAGVGGAP